MTLPETSPCLRYLTPLEVEKLEALPLSAEDQAWLTTLLEGVISRASDEAASVAYFSGLEDAKG